VSCRLGVRNSWAARNFWSAISTSPVLRRPGNVLATLQRGRGGLDLRAVGPDRVEPVAHPRLNDAVAPRR
jgi:hypothetical protein